MRLSDRQDLHALLSPHLPAYEPREAQAAMARAVARALEGSGRLVVEAATGTGKSLAYLIPLAEYAICNERRAIVATFTKTLQRQLVEKDLPFIRKHLFPGLRFTLALGSENYLCLRRLERFRAQGGLFDEDDAELDQLLEWTDNTPDGIRQGSGGKHWSQVSRESDTCLNRHCHNFTRCFYQYARDEQRRSHIIVANHHLYFSNIASEGRVLPECRVAVFDEAHELEDVASDFLGVEASNLRMWHIFNSVHGRRGKGILHTLHWLKPEERDNLASLVEAARLKADQFYAALTASFEGQSMRIRKPGIIEDCLSESLMRLGHELKRISDASQKDDESMELIALSDRAFAGADAVKAVLFQELEGHVYWAERSGRIVRLTATPVDIAGLSVFDHLESGVFTSATLATDGKFDYIRQRLGLRDTTELLLKSHFNYRENAALFIPREMPPPGTPGYEDAVIEAIAAILGRTRGRTLVLFTNYSLLRRAADAMDIAGVRILRQGEDDSYSLIERFKREPDTALFGTYTFWQGIDIPGEALKCVVITKLPFAVPDEPVTEARLEHLEAIGRDPFRHYSIPRAAITLKQGFGRLIRTSTDTGTVAILDSRVLTRSYGKVFMRSLPDAELFTDGSGTGFLKGV